MPYTHSKPTKDPFNPDFVKPLTFEEAYPKSTKEYLRVRAFSMCIKIKYVYIYSCVCVTGYRVYIYQHTH